MRPLRSHATQAIIIKRINYSEADRILTMLTPDLGKITAIAKGVRKFKSRKRGHIELFSHSKIHLVQGKNLYIITEAELLTSFVSDHPKLTASHKVSNAYHFAELIDCLLPESQTYPEIFDLLNKSYRYLDQPDPDLYQLSRSFKLRLLQILGFWPNSNQTPADLDAFIESILERPLKTSSFLSI